MAQQPVPKAPESGAQTPDPGAVEADEVLPRQFGKYTLLRKLASGGMAELYLALHRSVAGFEKLVVIKRILPQMNQDQAFIDMLLHEARIAATLSHPNIVQTFDVGQFEGAYFIAMEHIHGEDIRTIVRGMRKKNVTEFPLSHALSIVLGVCAGLAYAHEKRDLHGKTLSIVHRDISPQNIVITFTGDVKVVDFGIAKSEHFVEEQKGGQLKGKVPYMSPEQAAGNEIDWRSDIFAAGVILFELTTGRRLFKGQNEFETLKLITEREYPLPSDVAPNYPLALERVVMKALAKDRDKRYQSAREMQADLEAFVRNERIPVSTVSLSAWMQMLFEEKLAQQNEALHDIKQLADAIAAQHPLTNDAPFVSGMTGVFPAVDLTTQSQPGSASGQVASIPPVTVARKSPLGLVMGGLLVALAVGGGLLYATRQKTPLPVESTAAVAATAAPTAVPEAKGSLKVTTDPPGAAIWINGEMQNQVSPATLENLPIGREIKLKLSEEGYESYKEDFTLASPGAVKTIDAKMKTGSVSVLLDIVPEPSVWVDNKPWKGSPKKIDNLSAEEEHKIVVSASGFVPKTFTFTGTQGETKKFDFKLIKGDPNAVAPDRPDGGKKPGDAKGGGAGEVRVNAKGGFCNVTINGSGVGATPTGGTFPAGTVKVTCKPESGPSMTQSVTVEAGQTARVIFQIPQ